MACWFISSWFWIRGLFGMFLLWFFFLFPCGSISDYPSGITFSCGGSDARASNTPRNQIQFSTFQEGERGHEDAISSYLVKFFVISDDIVEIKLNLQ